MSCDPLDYVVRRTKVGMYACRIFTFRNSEADVYGVQYTTLNTNIKSRREVSMEQ